MYGDGFTTRSALQEEYYDFEHDARNTGDFLQDEDTCSSERPQNRPHQRNMLQQTRQRLVACDSFL